MAKKDKDFDLTNLPIEAQDPEIRPEDFVISDENKVIHEQKLQTKPTTFLRDSIRRFAKNKSSVVAAVILGALLLLSIIVPLADQSDVANSHPETVYLEPKLFPSGTGFWDGTMNYENIAVDTSSDPEGTDKDANWWPNPDRFEKSAVTKKVFTDETYTNQLSGYGKQGYVQTGYYNNIDDSKEYVEFRTQQMNVSFNVNVNHYVSAFDTYNVEKLRMVEGDEYAVLPENYVLGEAALYFNYIDGEEVKHSIELLPYSEEHNIGSAISSKATPKINVSEILKANSEETVFDKFSFSVRIKNLMNHDNTCILIKKFVFETESPSSSFKDVFLAPNFTDATECVRRESRIDSAVNYAYWSSTGTKQIYESKVVYCSFTYDSYEAKLGTKKWVSFPITKLEEYRKNGWLDWNYDVEGTAGHYHLNLDTFAGTVLNAKKCPVAEDINPSDVYVDPTNGDVFVDCMITYYKYYGFETMPIYLFGTDKTGRDMLKYVFEGLRTSLLLGIITTLVCCIIGLIYGAVSGYYGGTVDLVMERITDILSGVPWIVVMTLVIIHMGSNFFTFALALCLTGWIGTAATTRTQFYRFRGREYVLASRTLGASDARLIRKHILPNAMGTIITAEVLMVPSVIFSEATISYLGLGLKNLSSLGVILSNNQAELTTNSYLLIFPSVIIALLMISFNLFGNGLRDAVNPSLKGEEE